MDFPNLSFMSDADLVVMRHEVQTQTLDPNADREFIDAINAELKRRAAKLSASPQTKDETV